MASPPRADARPRAGSGRVDRLPLAAGLDTAAVVLFVALGRRTHDEDPGVAGLVATAAPFLIGLALAWVLVRAWRAPATIRTGLGIWPLTVVVGMVLRQVVFGEGTAPSFVVVATLFLGACFLGWRGILRATSGARHQT